jgi:hypothetical protein
MTPKAANRRLLLITAAVVLVGALVAIPLLVSRDGHGEYDPVGFEDPEELAEHILECLQSGDVEGFASACVSTDDFLAFMEATGQEWESVMQAEELMKADGEDRLLRKARSCFKLARRQLAWSEAELDRVEVEYKAETVRGLESCSKLVAHVRVDGKSVPVYLDTAVHALDGWKLFPRGGLGVGERIRGPAVLKGNETVAIATLRNLSSAQAHFQIIAIADADNDGTGEFGCFRELSGAGDIRGEERIGNLNPPVLSGRFRTPDEKGYISRSGYYFAIYLPGYRGAGVNADAHGYQGIDSDLAETTWCAYAWPVNYGNSGHRTFMVSQTGDIVATEDGEYTGSAGPAPDAAFRPPRAQDGEDLGADGGIRGPMAVDEEGADGNVWKRVN